MSVSSAFGALAELIERFEATEREVLGVTTREFDSANGEAVEIDLSVRTALFDDVDSGEIDLTPRDASVNEDGTATVDLAVSIPRSIESNSTAPTSEPTASESARSGTATTTGRAGEGAEPVHRDPERLEEVYDTRETFAEMTEALGAEVTPVTVRRNMIKHGIHEPRTDGSTTGSGDATVADSEKSDIDTGTDAEKNDRDGRESASAVESDFREPSADATASTGDAPPADGDAAIDGAGPATEERSGTEDSPTEEESDGSTEGPVAVPDGIGLPADLDLDRLKTVVSSSDTLYEAQTRLGLDRERTRAVLGDLGVLDLVHGRVSTREERTASTEEIDDRIRERLSGSS